MSLTLVPAHFVYGIPETLPDVPGYEVIASTNQWLKCRRGGKDFFLEILPDCYRLSPVAPNGGVTTDKQFTIPK
jgi:hypothetical protein